MAACGLRLAAGGLDRPPWSSRIEAPQEAGRPPAPSAEHAAMEHPQVDALPNAAATSQT